MEPDVRSRLRNLPSVSDVLQQAELKGIARTLPTPLLTSITRQSIEELRHSILSGSEIGSTDVLGMIENRINRLLSSSNNIVVNGTGTVIHTNLGRSPVSEAAAQAMAEHAARYQALELRLDTGKRGGRGDEVSELMRLLTGAEKTLVVNNNAAAVMLTLAALTAGREVIVSRGEAVEIGGGFRIPDVLRQSGARLVEVGTTNRTYLRDYVEATTGDTAAYLKVHASNFQISGFTASTSLEELSQARREHDVLLIEDVGSGCLLDTQQFGLAVEPTLADSISAGVDVVCASGDKLLGGPQAGLILGKADVVDHIARHPLARAFRADKTCLAGIAATLRHYLTGTATDEIPVWWTISREGAWLEQRVREWCDAIGSPAVRCIETESVVGGGSLPGQILPSWALAIEETASSSDELARALRIGTPAVMPRIVDDVVAIDARTVLRDEDHYVTSAVRALLA